MRAARGALGEPVHGTTIDTYQLPVTSEYTVVVMSKESFFCKICSVPDGSLDGTRQRLFAVESCMKSEVYSFVYSGRPGIHPSHP